jgi:hypothetical protein
MNSLVNYNNRLGVFEAACLLQRSRTSRFLKSCSHEKGEHSAPYRDLLRCKSCRSYKCFKHLLSQNNLHSVEVLLSRSKDVGVSRSVHTKWHQRHHRIDMNHESILKHQESERNGTRPPDLRLALALTAASYSVCMPSRYESVSLGWYDSVQKVSFSYYLEFRKRNEVV